MRANLMDALYGEEVRRTNRMGIGPTGLHEWAWMRFGLTSPICWTRREVARLLDDAGTVLRRREG